MGAFLPRCAGGPIQGPEPPQEGPLGPQIHFPHSWLDYHIHTQNVAGWHHCRVHDRQSGYSTGTTIWNWLSIAIYCIFHRHVEFRSDDLLCGLWNCRILVMRGWLECHLWMACVRILSFLIVCVAAEADGEWFDSEYLLFLFFLKFFWIHFMGLCVEQILVLFLL